MIDEDSPALNQPRAWAGLSQQGQLMIGVDELRRGTKIEDVVAHESVHDLLLKDTPAGLTQLALGAVALPPWPHGSLSRRCAKLLELSLAASRYTHEACATFIPSVGRKGSELERYLAQYPPAYLAAAKSLDWLRTATVFDDVKKVCAYAAAVAALSVPVIEDWQRAQMHDIHSAALFWSDPTRRPDRRFPVICQRLSTLSEGELNNIVVADVGVMVDLFSDVQIDGRAIPITPFDPDTWTPTGISSLFERIHGHWLNEISLDLPERDGLKSMLKEPWMFLNTVPTEQAVSVRATGIVNGEIADNAPAEIVDGYAFVKVLHNTSDDAMPGIEPIGKPTWWLSPGDAAVYLSSPGRKPRASHLRANAFRALLTRLPDGATVSVQDGGYFFGVGIGEPRLLNRRHVVLVENRTPRALADMVAITGLDQQRGPVLVSNALSEIPGMSYLLLRPASRPFPLIILPTATTTAMLMKDYLLADDGSIKFQFIANPLEFFGASGVLVFMDFGRVIHEFEGRPWSPELMPRL